MRKYWIECWLYCMVKRAGNEHWRKMECIAGEVSYHLGRAHSIGDAMTLQYEHLNVHGSRAVMYEVHTN